MKDLGENVVRVHLQLGKFMNDAKHLNDASLDRLGRLLALAERLDMYLDLTGLGCYARRRGGGYDGPEETERSAVQARFWEAIAERCAESPRCSAST